MGKADFHAMCTQILVKHPYIRRTVFSVQYFYPVHEYPAAHTSKAFNHSLLCREPGGKMLAGICFSGTVINLILCEYFLHELTVHILEPGGLLAVHPNPADRRKASE